MRAEIINCLVRDIVKSKVIKENWLKEVLGQTPLEASVEILFEIVVAQPIGDHPVEILL